MKKHKSRSSHRSPAAAARAAAVKIARARHDLGEARQELAAATLGADTSDLAIAGKWRAPADALERRREAILKLPGVVACGLGYKIAAGVDTREPALVVFVREKMPQEELARKGRKRLPRFVRVAGRRVAVDVVEMQTPQPHGTVGSIGPATGADSGTIGCLAFDAVTRQAVLITAGHVTGLGACTDPSSSSGDAITVPALFDDSGAPVIGSVAVATTFGVDAAKITISNSGAIAPFLPPVRIVGVRKLSDDIDVAVTMFGKMSGLQNGVIKYIGVAIPELCLENTLLVSIFTQAGDSGAGLVDSSALLVGLLFGLAPSNLGPFRVFCPASRVMRRLGCTIP